VDGDKSPCESFCIYFESSKKSSQIILLIWPLINHRNQSTNTEHSRRRREINHIGRTGRTSFASTYQDLVCVLGAVADLISQVGPSKDNDMDGERSRRRPGSWRRCGGGPRGGVDGDKSPVAAVSPYISRTAGYLTFSPSRRRAGNGRRGGGGPWGGVDALAGNQNAPPCGVGQRVHSAGRNPRTTAGNGDAK
jgi:hypothetical protein